MNLTKLFRIFKNILLPNYLTIIYRHEYFTTVFAGDNYQAFDVMKFKRVRDELIKQKLILPKNVLKPPKITEEQILRVHEQKYLQKLKNPVEVGKILGLDYVNPWDDYIFEYFKYITGGTTLGLELAVTSGKPVINLGGGFHHAHPDKGEGFCLLNDVAIAIENLKLSHPEIEKILIIDLDYHQGNGNTQYFANNCSVYTFSVHEENRVDISKKMNKDIELKSTVKDFEYMEILHHNLPKIFNSFMPDAVIYLAGGDIYDKDTLGAYNISELGVLKRDIFVYTETSKRNLPLLILAAGGYGPYSWKVYYNFIKWIILNRKLRTRYFPLSAKDVLS